MDTSKTKDIRYDRQNKSFSRDCKKAFLTMHTNASHQIMDAIEAFTKDNARDISTSQLRGVFSQVKKATPGEIPLLRAKLAYVKGRTDGKKKGMHSLLDILNALMKEISSGTDEENRNKLKSFKDFFEAVLSFHKLYGNN